MKKKVFLTLFPECENIHLIKDVGLIPYTFWSEYGYKSVIATFDNGEYTHIDDAVKGLEISKIKRKKRHKILDILSYIKKNAKKINILNLYHLDTTVLLSIIVYKLFNPKGKIYVKLDIGYAGLTYFENENFIKKAVRKKIINNVDLISAESKDITKKLIQFWNINNLKYIPNGIAVSDDEEIYCKKKQIITVGRLGSPEKQTELLIDAFSEIYKKIPDWNLILVGSVEKSLFDYAKQLFCKNPGLEEQVSFEGFIEDRREINEYYKNASIFILPSKFESFGLVLLEAMNFGCYIITTEGVASAHDLLPNDKYGKIVDVNKNGKENITHSILDTIESDRLELDNLSLIAKKTRTSFDWKKICSQIFNYMEERNE